VNNEELENVVIVLVNIFIIKESVFTIGPSFLGVKRIDEGEQLEVVLHLFNI